MVTCNHLFSVRLATQGKYDQRYYNFQIEYLRRKKRCIVVKNIFICLKKHYKWEISKIYCVIFNFNIIEVKNYCSFNITVH